MADCLNWDDSYAIARELIRRFPDIDLQNVSLQMIFRWTIELKDFCDETNLANDEILAAIYQEWFEEVNPI